MTRFAWLAVVGMAFCDGGCFGQQCHDEVDFSEDVAGQLTTANGTVALTMGEAADGLVLVPADGSAFPTFEFDEPENAGATSLATLHATVCTAAFRCMTAEGVLVYQPRVDLAPSLFDAQIGFFTTPVSGEDPVATGWAEVTGSKSVDQVCVDIRSGGGGGGSHTGLGDL